MHAGNMAQAATERPIEILCASGRTVDVQRNRLEIDLARRELGWAPTIGLDEGLRRTAAWLARSALNRDPS